MQNLQKDSSVFSRILACFFSKPQSEIDLSLLDSADWDDDLLGLGDTSLLQKGGSEVLEIADSLHARMISGVKIRRSGRVHEDLGLVAASLPAYQIAELACTVASGGGELQEIYRQMLVLQELYDVESDAALSQGCMPDLYLTLVNRSHELYERVFATVFVQVLERYHLDELVELFETGQVDFEVRFEVGRRLLNPVAAADVAENLRMTEDLRDRFGDESVKRLQTRLASNGLQ